MSLLTENNRQYYEGAQGFRSDGTTVQFTTTFDTDLKFYENPLKCFLIYKYNSNQLPVFYNFADQAKIRKIYYLNKIYQLSYVLH